MDRQYSRWNRSFAGGSPARLLGHGVDIENSGEIALDSRWGNVLDRNLLDDVER